MITHFSITKLHFRSVKGKSNLQHLNNKTFLLKQKNETLADLVNGSWSNALKRKKKNNNAYLYFKLL